MTSFTSYMMKMIPSFPSFHRNSTTTSNPQHNIDDTFELLSKTKSNTSLFSLNGKTFTAKVVYIYDGDTIHVVFKVFGEYHRWNCRISGVDTPEMRTKNENEKKMGYHVRDVLREKFQDKIVQVKCGEFDKYGRLLLDVVLPDDMLVDGQSEKMLSEWLIANQYAYSYDGGTKQAWDDINFIA